MPPRVRIALSPAVPELMDPPQLQPVTRLCHPLSRGLAANVGWYENMQVGSPTRTVVHGVGPAVTDAKRCSWSSVTALVPARVSVHVHATGAAGHLYGSAATDTN